MKKYLSLSLAFAMVLSSMQSFTVAGAQAVWQQGWTGKAGSNNFSVTADGEKVVLTNNKVNNGKFSDGEDSVIYYAAQAAADSDFELSATVHIDEFSVMEESSNPNQSSVGIAVLDDLYNKTDEVSYTNSVFLGTWAEKKTDDIAFYPITRDNSAEKSEGEALSDSFANSGTDLGDYKLSIKKTGSAYTLTCGENSQTVEVSSMSEQVYPCLYIARNVKATFTDVDLKVDSRKAVSMTLEGQPKSTYFYDEQLDLSGLKAVVTYDDGSKEEVSDYLVKGYNPRKIGKQTVKLSRGNVSAQLEVNVKKRMVTKLNVEYAPVKTDYNKGMPFRADGLQVQAQFDDGTTKTLEADNYELKLNGKTLKDGDALACTGKTNVKVLFKDNDGYKGGGSYDTFMLNVENKALTGIEITPPEKTLYYVGDDFDKTGMRVYAVYGDERVLLNADEYTVSGFNSSISGENNVSISMNGSNAASVLKLTVVHRQGTALKVLKYPRTTYLPGESFDDSSLKVGIVYDNGDVEELDKNQGYSVQVGDAVPLEDGSYTNTVSVISDYSELSAVSFKIITRANEENVWRKTVFGQSSGYDKQESGQAGITAENYGTASGKVNVRSWEGTGKITNDHDGMSYYYTTVEGDKNFELSAVITVNKYLEHNNDDTKRNGQEGFGIMLRDVIPLKTNEGTMTTDTDAAQKDAEGVAIPLEGNSVFASNMMLVGGYSGTGYPTDKSAVNYEKNANINRINMLVRDGVEAPDGGGKRIGPVALSSSFPKEGNKYAVGVKKVNGGVYAWCKDLQTDELKESCYYDDSFLTMQNSKAVYAGFFAARWADIDVENIVLHESEKAYDETVASNEIEKKTPAVEIDSAKYTTDTEYTVKLHSEDSKGLVSVRLNDRLIAEDLPIDKNGVEISTSLRKNAENKLTVLYTPDDTLSLTSYEPIIARQSVLCKDFNQKAAQVYVSPEGSFKGDGTAEKPYDIDTAIGLIAPGQTIVMQEGVYYRSTPIEIELGNDGTADKPKTLMAEKDKSVVLDYQGASQGVIHTGNYWNIKNIEFRHSGDNLKCYHLGGSHNVIENCTFHDNGDLGLQISRTYGTEDRSLWPSYNTILNCEAYNNCDPSMINADGFGAKLTVGEGNVFKGCKSHHNLDDGWDLYTKVNSGAIGAVTLDSCQAYKNGYRLNEDGTESEYGKGGNNGFKLGGENVGVKHKLINCLAYDNMHNGVTTNSNPMLSLENVKSYNNGAANLRLYSDKPQEYSYDLKGVVSYNGGEDDVIGSLTEDTQFKNNSDVPILSESNYLTVNGSSKNSAGTVATEDLLK